MENILIWAIFKFNGAEFSALSQGNYVTMFTSREDGIYFWTNTHQKEEKYQPGLTYLSC